MAVIRRNTRRPWPWFQPRSKLKWLTCGVPGLLALQVVVSLVWLHGEGMQQLFLEHSTAAAASTAVYDYQRVPPSFNASNPTLVIQLRGELGNHLSSIVHGYGIKWYAAEAFGIQFQPLLRHQVFESTPSMSGIFKPAMDSPKWIPTKQELQQCFPRLRLWNFDRGAGWDEFYQREREQQEWLSPQELKRLSYINGRPWLYKSNRPAQTTQARDVNEALDTFGKIWQNSSFSEGRRKPRVPGQLISLPYLYSTSLENAWLIDQYLDKIRQLLEFDYHREDCCGSEPPPQADETVLHFRNFQTELSGGSSSGLEDLDPQQTANILLGHLQAGDKVVITTGRHNELLYAQIAALQARDLQVRVVQGQTGIQDFCFLLKSQKEFVGNFQSTFALWAAMLGQAQSVRLYTLDSPRLRQRFGSDDAISRRFLFNWTHPALIGRLYQQLIPPPVLVAASVVSLTRT